MEVMLNSSRRKGIAAISATGMGKKTRPGTGGRRTILQLSPPGLRSGTVGGTGGEALGSESDEEKEVYCDGHILMREETTNMRTPAVKATEGLSLLGAYEDSDDEDTDYQPTSGRSLINQSTDIDSTLANFMAEIDAITTQPGSEEPSVDPQAPAPTPPRPEPKAQQPGTDSAAEHNSTGADFQYNTQCSLAGVGVDMGDWQEVWDENTSCYYYWNTLTNEVAWELPHYLADQVQGLQHYADSTSVNGNGASQPAVYYPEQTTAAISVMPPKKETKKKEVMESVVALTSEEEEHRGVAASLLAPLIPAEVVKEEELWRKRLLGGLDDQNSRDSDGEQAVHPGSPAGPPPLRDLDAAFSLGPREQRSRNQSQDNSDAEEEEPEEDTIELELALERKRAELRALEEGDGSGGGSSPCSEASQDPSGSRCLLQKKARWKTSFLRTASPDSNSRESDALEKPETTHSKAVEKVVEPEELQTARGEQDAVSKGTPKEEVETQELKFQIGELANTLTSKMEFLGINRKAISNFQLLLLQTEMRIADWREGALNGIYLRRRLQEAAEHIKHYELNATPKGWSCHWDREHRRYFYVNDRTNASQWDFPNKEEEEEEDQPQQPQQPPQPRGSSDGEPTPPALAPSPGIAGSSTFAPMPPPEPVLWSAPQPPLPPDQPPPPADYPPPPPPPPESPPPPPPPPDSDDGEIMEVEMEDEEGEPPAPGTEEDGSVRPPLPPGSSSTKNVESSVSMGKGHKRKAAGSGLPSKAVTIGSSPILYTQTCASAAPVLCGSAYWAVPVVAAPSLPAETLAPPLPPPPAQPPLPTSLPPSDPPGAKMAPTDKTKKLKKDKSKKSKTKMPSLVKKWQSIQKELDEEEKSSSSEEDRDQLNKRGIEEWKQQQFLTGKAGKNANFEALPEDWRERMLKKRKMMKSK